MRKAAEAVEASSKTSLEEIEANLEGESGSNPMVDDYCYSMLARDIRTLSS